jgi:hypothetical protein
LLGERVLASFDPSEQRWSLLKLGVALCDIGCMVAPLARKVLRA